ncbi:MAG: hypothetical protein AABW50_05120 [Nanoarchaeota archaeon]
MTDIFDNQILCRNCDKKMNKAEFIKNGFRLRAVVCDKCDEKIIHPADEAEYSKFVGLKNKEFNVKMRLVGNSYAVSIPKEIVSFMREQESRMDNMVRLCFEDLGRVSLSFNQHEIENKNARVIRAREYRVIKNNKSVLHFKQFSDSASPKHNKTLIRRNDDKKEIQA